MDECLGMLKNASPTEEDEEEETIRDLEQNCREMGTLIEKKVLECEHKKNDLEDLNQKFIKALNMYQSLMKEPIPTPQPPPVFAASPAHMYRQPVAQQVYQPVSVLEFST